MRMTKRIIAVMVAVMMVMAMSVCTVSAAAVVDKFEVIEFSILNAAGTDADTIGAGKTVTVRTVLKRVEGANNTDVEANIIAAVYSGNEMVDVAGSSKVYYNYGTTQVNDVQLTIPAGKTDLTFKAFLWDGDMITPLAKSSDEAEITGITIGGVEVEGFDADTTSYNVELPVGSGSEPAVYVEANGITNADVTYTDGVATISTINGNYTINYTIEPSQIVELMYDGNTWTDANEVYSVVDRGPRVLKSADPRLTADTTFRAVLGDEVANYRDYVSVAWTDRGLKYFESVPAEIEGVNFIPMSYNNERSGTRADWTVTTNDDMRVYFFSWSNEIISGATVIRDNLSVDEYTLRDMNDAAFDTVIGSVGIHNLSSALSSYRLCYIDVIVPEGQETATATVRSRNVDFMPNMFMYKFHKDMAGNDEEVVGPALSATATANGKALSLGNVVRKPTYVYDEAAGNYQLGATLSDAAATIYGNYATRLNAHDYAFIQDCPDEMVGAKGTTWSDAAMGTSSEMGSVDVTLTINRDATVYLDTTDAFVAKSGAVAINPITYRSAGNGYSVVEGYTFEDADGEAADYHGGRLFKLELDVPDGASSATFIIPAAYYGSQYPIFYVK